MDIVQTAVVIGLGTIGLYYVYKVVAKENDSLDCVPGIWVIIGAFAVLYMLVEGV